MDGTLETPPFKRTVGINKSQLNHSATCCGCKANEKIPIYENKIYSGYSEKPEGARALCQPGHAG